MPKALDLKNLQNLTLLASVLIDQPIEAAEGEKPKNRRFKIEAYDGGFLSQRWSYYPFVVDIAGMQKSRPTLPILIAHDPSIDGVLGQADSVDFKPSKVLIVGEILGVSEEAEKTVKLADRGFKFQASIGAQPLEVQFIAEGEAVKANGKTHKGPCYYVAKSDLFEVSFVTIGAAKNTSATIAASLRGENAMPTFEEWLLAQGVDPATVSDEMRPLLKAAYDNAHPKEPPKQTATATQEPPKEPVQAKGGDGVDLLASFRENAAKEVERQGEIQKIAAQHPKIAAQAIRENRDVDWVKTQVELATLRASRPGGPAIHAGAPTGAGATPAVIEAAMAMATNLPNLEKRFDAKTLEAAHDAYKERISLHQFLIEAAQRSGQFDERAFRITKGNVGRVLKAAFSSIEVSGILSNTANKHLANGFNGIDTAWRQIAAISPVDDFKEQTHYSLTGDLIFEKVGPDGELKHGTLGEETYGNKAETYGKILSITRQDIINDDLGAFARVPFKLGRGSALKVNDVFWTEFFADNGTFYTVGRKNYAAGAGTALSIESIGAALALWATQVDGDGHPLGTPAAILLVTPTDALAAETYINDAFVQGSTSRQPTKNPVAGKLRKVVSTPYMSNANYGNSAVHWFLIADPLDLPLIEFVSLDGAEMPVIETAEADFNTLGIQMRGFFDFGVRKQEYRAGQKQKGAA